MTGIYVIQADKHCKIGVSRDIPGRINSLQGGSPYPLSLAYSGECGSFALELERKAHAILKERRRKGEWFHVSPEEAVQAVLDAAADLGIELLPPTSGREVRKLVAMSKELWDRIEEYRWQNRIASESDAIRQLLNLGLIKRRELLEANQQPPRKPRKGR